MKKFTSLALAAALSSLSLMPAVVHAEATAVTAGKPLYGADSKRIGSIYYVRKDGNVELILDGKLYVVNAATISVAGGKITTSLKKSEVVASR